MNTTEVLKLIDAGFTAEEIRGMIAKDPAPAQAPEAAATQEPEAAAPADPTPKQPEQVPEAAPGPDPLDEIKQQIAGLTSTVKEMSKSIIMPNMEDIKPQGIEDIISNFFKED